MSLAPIEIIVDDYGSNFDNDDEHCTYRYMSS